MEGCIKYNYLRYILAEYIKAGSDALYMSGIVKRCKGNKAFDILDNLFIHKTGFLEDRTPLD